MPCLQRESSRNDARREAGNPPDEAQFHSIVLKGPGQGRHQSAREHWQASQGPGCQQNLEAAVSRTEAGGRHEAEPAAVVARHLRGSQ